MSIGYDYFKNALTWINSLRYILLHYVDRWQQFKLRKLVDLTEVNDSSNYSIFQRILRDSQSL